MAKGGYDWKDDFESVWNIHLCLPMFPLTVWLAEMAVSQAFKLSPVSHREISCLHTWFDLSTSFTSSAHFCLKHMEDSAAGPGTVWSSDLQVFQQRCLMKHWSYWAGVNACNHCGMAKTCFVTSCAEGFSDMLSHHAAVCTCAHFQNVNHMDVPAHDPCRLHVLGLNHYWFD